MLALQEPSVTEFVTCSQRGAASRYRSYGDVFREIMRKDGVRGLYCGIVPEYAKVRALCKWHEFVVSCLAQDR